MADNKNTPLQFHVISFFVPRPPSQPYRTPVALKKPFRCASCGTARTPIRRMGPDGRRNLCNACGLQWTRRKVEKQHRAIDTIASSDEKPSQPLSSETDVKEGKDASTTSSACKMTIGAILNADSEPTKGT